MGNKHAVGVFVHWFGVLHMDGFRKTRKSGNSVDNAEKGPDPFVFGFGSRRLENEHMFLYIHLRMIERERGKCIIIESNTMGNYKRIREDLNE